MQPLPEAADAPVTVIPVYGLPRWEVVRHQPPGVAATQDVEHTVKDVSSGPDARSSRVLRTWEKRLQDSPFLIGQDAAIDSARHSPAYVCTRACKIIFMTFRNALY